MEQTKLIDLLAQADDQYILEAAPNTNRSRQIKRWAAVAAASLILLAGGTTLARNASVPQADPIFTSSAVITESDIALAYGFTFQDRVYFPASLTDLIRFGIISPQTSSLTDIYTADRKDVGELIGTVSESMDSTLIGAKIYRYAALPQVEALCILEKNATFCYYTTAGPSIPLEVGEFSDVVLEAYDLPGAIQTVTILNEDGSASQTVTDQDELSQLFTLLSGKTNIGQAAHEELFAKLWYDTYGTREVHYDREEGVMLYGPSDEAYDKAHALWGKGQVELMVETTDGFILLIIYTPSIGTLNFSNGFFTLTPDESSFLSRLTDPS